MTTVNIHEAKTHLSSLVDKAINGEEIIIAKAGDPYVKLTPIKKIKRRLGVAKGQFTLGKEFFEPMSDEELKEWE